MKPEKKLKQLANKILSILAAVLFIFLSAYSASYIFYRDITFSHEGFMLAWAILLSAGIISIMAIVLTFCFFNNECSRSLE